MSNLFGYQPGTTDGMTVACVVAKAIGILISIVATIAYLCSRDISPLIPIIGILVGGGTLGGIGMYGAQAYGTRFNIPTTTGTVQSGQPKPKIVE